MTNPAEDLPNLTPSVLAPWEPVARRRQDLARILREVVRLREFLAEHYPNTLYSLDTGADSPGCPAACLEMVGGCQLAVRDMRRDGAHGELGRHAVHRAQMRARHLPPS